MESRMAELMEAIQESEGQAERRVLTLLGGRYISEKALVIDGKIVWESRKNGYFHGYTDEIKNITESGITYIGNEKVFCDTLGQEKQIVICGAGHVSIPVIKMAVMMDCEVIVLEDRPMYADHARLAGASQVICEPFEEALDKIQGSADTYFVILTRGHRYDQICLEKIAAKEHAYIGMIGSRRRTALVKQSLAEKGVDQEVLDAVYTPIGLDIGAQTPAEIGVAIIAEIIEVKNRKKRTYGYSKEIMRALTAQEPYPEKKIMATIITRHGSAPQGLGTKMLIYRDGRCVGTIGGGCMEARVIQIARQIFKWAAEGITVTNIAQRLNIASVPTPSVYLANIRGKYKTRSSWSYDSVRNILYNRIYTGDTVPFKSHVVRVGSKRVKQVPPELQQVIPNTHEAIISHEQYDRALAVIKSVKKSRSAGSDNPFTSLLICGCCGNRLSKGREKNKTWLCSMHRYNPKADCKSVRIDNGRLEQIVLRAIKTQCALLDAKVRSIEKESYSAKAAEQSVVIQ